MKTVTHMEKSMTCIGCFSMTSEHVFLKTGNERGKKCDDGRMTRGYSTEPNSLFTVTASVFETTFHQLLVTLRAALNYMKIEEKKKMDKDTVCVSKWKIPGSKMLQKNENNSVYSWKHFGIKLKPVHDRRHSLQQLKPCAFNSDTIHTLNARVRFLIPWEVQLLLSLLDWHKDAVLRWSFLAHLA